MVIFFFFFFFFWGGGGGGKGGGGGSLVLQSFQGYFTYFEPIVDQRWAKSGVSGEKPPNVPLQNLASHTRVVQKVLSLTGFLGFTPSIF